MKNAVLLYFDPKIASRYSIWCLEPLAGIPAVRRFAQRLQSGLPAGEFDVYAVCHEAATAHRIAACLDQAPMKVFQSVTLNRLAAIADFCKKFPHYKTLLLFPEGSFAPDCPLTLSLLQRHRNARSEGTVASGYPSGLLPEIYESKSILRLENLGLPGTLSDDFTAIMTQANALFDEEPEMRFKIEIIPDALDGSITALSGLPSHLLVKTRRDLAVAAQVLAQSGIEKTYDSRIARAFKQALLRHEESTEFQWDIPPAPPGTIPILFSTRFDGFSGAEESFSLLITHLDRKRFHPIALLSEDGVLAQKVRDAGVPVVLAGDVFSEATPRIMAFLDALVKRLGIRLVHINVDAGYPLPLAARYAGVPVVFHVRTLPGLQALPLLPFGAAIIAISDIVSADLQRADIVPEKIHRIYNGIDLSQFNPVNFNRDALRRDAGIDQKCPVISLVARITPQKRQKFLLEAFVPVLKKFPNALLLLVGEVYKKNIDYQTELLHFVQAAGLTQNVRFWGFEKEPAKIYAMSDILALCTVHEPLGRCVTEAQAMHCPVIAPNRAGPTELIRHNIDGWLYDPLNPNALTQGLLYLLSDESLRERLADAGAAKADQFEIAKHVNEIAHLYDQILAGLTVQK